MEEETASAAARADWAAAEAAQKALDDQSALRWEVVARKMAGWAEKPREKSTKARHDPSKRTCVEDPTSEAALRPTQRTEATKPSEQDASAPVDLEVIPDTPEAEVADAPELILEAPEMTMDAPDAADPPPAVETTLAWASMEPATNQPPEAGAIFVTNRVPAAPGAGSNTRSRLMKTWCVDNVERVTMTPDAELSSVPELVAMFASSRDKVKQAARVAHNDLERVEERTRVSASSFASSSS